MVTRETRFDVIGYWSEVKLAIVNEYAKAYSTIFTKRKLSHVYIDGFAGPGVSINRSTGELVPGSPLNALNVEPGFDDYYLVDLDGDKADFLRELIGDRPNVHIFQGDCNKILLEEIFPCVCYKDFRRGLCLLDPYGLHLDWEVIETAGKLSTIDLFLNFPIMDMNRNVLWRDHSRVSQGQRERMTAFWGDDSWRQAAYRVKPDLFGGHDEKADNTHIAEAYCEHLRHDAGFSHVAEPLPMRNKRGAVVYYLIFASQRPVAQHIVSEIFAKYRDRGAPIREG